MIDVEARGRAYQEMHVDGGTMKQVFIYPPSLNVKKLSAELRVQRERKIYVIRNSRLDAEWAQVDRRTFSIAGRAISTLIHSQDIGDLYRIYLTSRRGGFDFHLAYIPPTSTRHTSRNSTPSSCVRCSSVAMTWRYVDILGRGFPLATTARQRDFRGCGVKPRVGLKLDPRFSADC